MSDSLTQRAEKLAIRCRATLDSPSGTPLRTEKILLEHRQLVAKLEQMIEQSRAEETFISGFLRLARNTFEKSSLGSNGLKSWRRDIPQDVKTALILMYQFIQRHR